MCSRFADVLGDLDDRFAYVTARKVAIRDRRLGLLATALKIVIFLYVIVYVVILSQQYLKPSAISGISRLSLKRPSSAYRWPDGKAPYCLGSSAINNPDPRIQWYEFPAPGYYKYIGPGGGGIVTQQLQCDYLDARMAVPTPPEGGTIVQPSRLSTIDEGATPAASCDQLQHSYCEWKTNSTVSAYIADPEFSTILLDTAFSTASGVARSSTQMIGVLLDLDDQPVDPCDVYDSFPAGCPSFINIGDRDRAGNDIVALKTLLNAAGVETLDQVTGTTGTFPNETKRYSGAVLVLQFTYSNYALAANGLPGTGKWDTDVVKYTIKATVVPEQEFKAETVVTPNNDFPSNLRTVYNRHGVRVLIIQSGTVGAFNFQTLLVNLTVALGLLSVSVLVTDFIAFNLCPQRRLFQQYATRKTVDMSDVLAKKEDLPRLMARFADDDNLVDPIPPVFAEIIAQHRIEELHTRRVRVAGKLAGVEAQIAAVEKKRAEEAAAEAARKSGQGAKSPGGGAGGASALSSKLRGAPSFMLPRSSGSDKGKDSGKQEAAASTAAVTVSLDAAPAGVATVPADASAVLAAGAASGTTSSAAAAAGTGLVVATGTAAATSTTAGGAAPSLTAGSHGHSDADLAKLREKAARYRAQIAEIDAELAGMATIPPGTDPAAAATANAAAEAAAAAALASGASPLAIMRGRGRTASTASTLVAAAAAAPATAASASAAGSAPAGGGDGGSSGSGGGLQIQMVPLQPVQAAAQHAAAPAASAAAAAAGIAGAIHTGPSHIHGRSRPSITAVASAGAGAAGAATSSSSSASGTSATASLPPATTDGTRYYDPADSNVVILDLHQLLQSPPSPAIPPTTTASADTTKL